VLLTFATHYMLLELFNLEVANSHLHESSADEVRAVSCSTNLRKGRTGNAIKNFCSCNSCLNTRQTRMALKSRSRKC